ncbi:hypothetical protein N7507_003487 [Penicillium longicatenatum]|nr:hypothetical protein N7507_003487 [Penicillium longicatenatum]
MPLSKFVKWCQKHSLTSSSDHKEPLEPPSSINPQIQSPLFRLPVEIRIEIYRLLFGNRVLHCERDWIDEKRKKWFLYAFVCFADCERLDWDDCAGRSREGQRNATNEYGLFFDTGLLRTCWRAYTESLSILYDNEFRFSHERELCTTFPNQVSSSGFQHIRRVALWWTLGNDRQPHVSPKNKDKYDSLWRSLGETYKGLTHIRIYIDSAYLAPMNSADVAGDTESTRRQHMQNAWLDGIETMVEGNNDLEVFEVYFYTKVYQVLRNRVKPWLKEKEEQRRAKNNAVRYKAYKCRSTTIKYAYCFSSPDGNSTDLSDGSSHIGIEDPKSMTFGWLRERRKLKQRQKIQQSQSDV